MSQDYEVRLPRDNVNDCYVTILDTPFQNGDFVKKDSIIIEYETSKANVEMASEYEGFIQYNCAVGDEVEPGSLVVKIFGEKQMATSVPAKEVKEIKKNTKTIFSKSARQLLYEKNISEETFSDYDFVTKEIVLETIANHTTNQKNTSNDEYEIVKISPSKKREINNLMDVQKHSLISSLFVRINLENVLDFVHNNSSQLKTSILPVVIFEISRMLLKHKEFNAFFNEDSIYYYKKINIGFAVDMGKELRVLTIYDADRKSFTKIEEEVLELSNKYLDEKLTPEDMSNSSFTISDLSGEGAASFIPLVNSHQSAIMGIGNVDHRKESIFVITFDHRIMNGKMVADFLNELKERLESYYVESANDKLKLVCSKCLVSLEEENKLNNNGFIKIIDGEGKDSLICLNCLRGW